MAEQYAADDPSCATASDASTIIDRPSSTYECRGNGASKTAQPFRRFLLNYIQGDNDDDQ